MGTTVSSNSSAGTGYISRDNITSTVHPELNPNRITVLLNSIPVTATVQGAEYYNLTDIRNYLSVEGYSVNSVLNAMTPKSVCVSNGPCAQNRTQSTLQTSNQMMPNGAMTYAGNNNGNDYVVVMSPETFTKLNQGGVFGS